MLSDNIESNKELSTSPLQHFPSIIEKYEGLSEGTFNALKEASMVYEYPPSLPKLIRTSKYEIPIKINNNNQMLELEFTLLGLQKTKDNGENFTREEWINILKENTPISSKYLWDLLKLEDCVLDNGYIDKSLLNIKLKDLDS